MRCWKVGGLDVRVYHSYNLFRASAPILGHGIIVSPLAIIEFTEKLKIIIEIAFIEPLLCAALDCLD